MTDDPSESNDSQLIPISATRSRPAGWQVGIRTLILLTAVIAVSMTIVVNKNEIERLEKRNRPMRSIARELKIDDLEKFAVVKLDSLWMNDYRWDIYLPPGEYRVCLATRDVGYPGICPPAQTAKLGGGRHRLALDFQRMKDGWPIRVTSDGSELIASKEVQSWGASGISSDYLTGVQSEQLPASEALVLYRRQYMDQGNPGGSPDTWKPGEGLILWIERVKPTEPTSPQ